MKENSLYDKKSLKEITGKSADWNEVAKDCVAFSNAQGGIIDYGIEDDAEEPMPNQRVARWRQPSSRTSSKSCASLPTR